MKKITLGCSAVVAAAMIFAACNKKTNTPPEQDTEFQSSKDVAFATSVVADLDLICGYMGENQLLTSYFQPAPGSGGSIATSRDTANKILTVTFSNSVTCRDGKKREGTITLNYASVPATNGAKFYRDAGFVGTVTLNNYWVNGWLIDDVVPFKITNKTPFGYNPSSEKLSWELNGHFTMKYLADTTKNCTWKGVLVKTLTNSTNPLVLNPNKLIPIAWSTTTASPGANLEYTGTAEGTGSGITPFKMVIDELKESKPLVRQYSCSPDKVLGVYSTTTTPSTLVPVNSEWHPFVGGVVQFTTGSKPDARRLDFSNDGETACDNAGKVTIRGIDYSVDFMK